MKKKTVKKLTKEQVMKLKITALETKLAGTLLQLDMARRVATQDKELLKSIEYMLGNEAGITLLEKVASACSRLNSQFHEVRLNDMRNVVRWLINPETAKN